MPQSKEKRRAQYATWSKEKRKEESKKRRLRKDSYKAVLWKRLLACIKNRCNNPSTYGYAYYGGKGIKCRLTYMDVARLWFRDQAWMMDRPELDRIDADKDYCIENCRFLPKLDNLRRMHEEEGDISFNVEEFEQQGKTA